ncbi:type II toxin-antitoxin system HicA family toxin [Peptoniphilus asaccharolyticus]
MKSYNSRELLKILNENGWIETGISRGSHLYMHNPDKPELGKVTIPHPRDNYPIKTLKSIEKQTGVKL